eukprot:764650-Hanusia_phi.AAC.1
MSSRAKNKWQEDKRMKMRENSAVSCWTLDESVTINLPRIGRERTSSLLKEGRSVQGLSSYLSLVVGLSHANSRFQCSREVEN